MGELAIKIRIADREYPMKVDPTDEERVRRAGKLLNEKLKQYKDRFGIDDKQDLLAMVAFESLTDKLLQEEESEDRDDRLYQKIHQLNGMLAKVV
ncbi:MAG TPA: cell division protein ZapA [Cytophagales bacterium]|nr:cell division protein ZapA [Cytophagales bacterium]HAA21226.1 cell division protein ZapA [Cytophagales bacterium]HAP60624.1 cell division protein ZapA [Cytophagales bacterium]